jgi:hypothetical protein
MSLNLGALVSVSGSSLNKVAGISVRHAFFAPAIGICPDSCVPPFTTIRSTAFVPLSWHGFLPGLFWSASWLIGLRVAGAALARLRLSLG